MIPMLFFSIENVTFKTNIKHLAAVMRFARSESINHKSVQMLEINLKEGSYILKENKSGEGAGMGMEGDSGGTTMGDESGFNAFNDGEEGGTKKTSGGGKIVYDVPHMLGKNIQFEKVVIKDSEITDGSAKIYFFPKGNTTGGKIYVVNNKGKAFSISLDSITGRVFVEKEEEGYYRYQS